LNKKISLDDPLTIGELLTELEDPANAEQISEMIEIIYEKNLHVDEIRKMRGPVGALARFVLRFTDKHSNAFTSLAKCRTADDIALFKRTEHYEKIKKIIIQ